MHHLPCCAGLPSHSRSPQHANLDAIRSSSPYFDLHSYRHAHAHSHTIANAQTHRHPHGLPGAGRPAHHPG